MPHKLLAPAVLLPLLCLAAAAPPSTAPSPTPAGRPSPAALPMIAWDPGTLRLIDRGGDYGRLARLPDGSLACVYNARGQVLFRRSADDGRTWADPVAAAADPDCWLTNAHLLPLRDGTLLYLWNERPNLAVAHQHNPAPPPGLLTRPFLIRAARSADLGHTWSPPQTLYTAGPSYQDGCWEPAAIQLPTGEVHVYFANEFPYPATAEQEISLLRSTDNGHTWSPAQRASFRPGHRDGMPAPLILAPSPGEPPVPPIALAVEDSGLAGGPPGRFKIAILTTPDDWRTSRRDPAVPLPPHVYAGAPHLARLPTGHTLLSCQESDDGTLESARMAVYVGDPSARHFANRTTPLPAPAPAGQLWNAVFVKDSKTVTAILTATVDGVRGVYTIDGRVTPPPPPAEQGERVFRSRESF